MTTKDMATRTGGAIDFTMMYVTHDAFRRDAHDQGGAHVGEGVVGPHPAPAPAARGPLAGVGDEAGFAQPPDALPHRRLGEAGLGGQLGPGEPRSPHQGAQHVLVGQGPEQFQRRPGGFHPPNSRQES